MIVNRENLGTCKVHLEVTHKDNKCFKLIESWNYPTQKRKSMWGWETETVWLDSRKDKKRKNPHYYALWGNSHDDQRMGCTKLTTPKGANVRTLSNATKKFFELINASEKMTFKM